MYVHVSHDVNINAHAGIYPKLVASAKTAFLNILINGTVGPRPPRSQLYYKEIVPGDEWRSNTVTLHMSPF